MPHASMAASSTFPSSVYSRGSPCSPHHYACRVETRPGNPIQTHVLLRLPGTSRQDSETEIEPYRSVWLSRDSSNKCAAQAVREQRTVAGDSSNTPGAPDTPSHPETHRQTSAP